MGAANHDPRTEEVRVAMALNGGVSLAVWMGGSAVELDAARRAHLGEEEMPGEAPDRTIYAALCKALRRELVVDLMSGASAGGINGGLLGAAIVHGRRLHPDFLRRSWLELGEIDHLLQAPDAQEAKSLMRGELLHAGLEQAFKGLLGEDELSTPPREPQPLDVKLEVTTTDIGGSPRRVRDYWRGVLEAREYRARFQFHRAGDFVTAKLAAAGRASASFPGAFEPYPVPPPAAELAGIDPTSPWVLDGGLLDNAPIQAVLDLVPFRSADRGVTRLACYLNADPVTPPDPSGKEPTPFQIAGYVVNLPRKAPFVDQLYALDRATNRGLAGGAENRLGEADLALLALPAVARRELAQTLLPTYRRARLVASLEDLLEDPADAADAADASGDLCLPWIPDTLQPMSEKGRWQWGLRAAERALHLLLDALRRRVAEEPAPEVKLSLFDARGRVYDELTALEDERETALAAQDAADPIVRARNADEQVDFLGHVQTAAAIVARAGLDERQAAALFGEDPAAAADHFIHRALELEVIRRSMNDGQTFETAQAIHFVQLTPTAPSLLFTDDPWSGSPWVSARQKLLGVLLGHFGGFYRRSWRANDFMWGRLDAAVRVVEMLVSGVRARQLTADGWADEPPWNVLADALLPDDSSDVQRRLVREAIASAPPGYPKGVFDEAPAEDGLPGENESLARALEHDLTDRSCGAKLTLFVCARAAQLEIFTHELPYLIDEAKKDAKLGAGSPRLDFDDLAEAMRAMRDTAVPPASRLRGPAEATSRLAVRTEAHALLAALGVLGSAVPPALKLRSLLARWRWKGARAVAKQSAERLS